MIKQRDSFRITTLISILLVLAACSDGNDSNLKLVDQSWGAGFLSAQGENADAPLCEAIVGLYRDEIDISNAENQFIGHVQVLETLRNSLPEDASQQAQNDFALLIDTFIAVRDANGIQGTQAFNRLSDPELAGAEGRLNSYFTEYCGISVGDPSYSVDTDTGPATACPGWPRAGSPLTANTFPNLLDTSAANYFLNTFNHGGLMLPSGFPGFIDVPLGGRVEFVGEYPKARYFAFHPSDALTNNFNTIKDVGLIPNPGSKNPWIEPTVDDEFNTFTAVLDFTQDIPAVPAQNTSYVGRFAVPGGNPEFGIDPESEPNPVVFNMLRNYGSYLGALPPNFTGVKLPEINIYDAQGMLVQHFEACDPYPQEFTIPEDDTKFPSWPVIDSFASNNPGEVLRSWQFGAPIDVLTNADVFYTVVPFTKLRGNVLVVRAKKPSSSAPNANPRIDGTAQARLFTACSYNFWNGSANDCVSEEDIPVDPDGFYTLVISEPEDRPKNATSENHITWLDWGPFIDGRLPMRNLMVDDPFWVNLAQAIDTGNVPPGFDGTYVPVAAHCHTDIFEDGGVSACFEWDQEQYGD